MKRFDLPVIAAILSLLASSVCAEDAAAIWPKLAPFFAPPAEFAGDFGTYRSPLKFVDGRTVKTAAEWPERRAEILKSWHERLGLGRGTHAPNLAEDLGLALRELEIRLQIDRVGIVVARRDVRAEDDAVHEPLREPRLDIAGTR